MATVRVRKRSKNKDSYEIIIDYGFVDGKRKTETKTITALDDKDAERQADIIRGQMASGKKVSTTKITVGEYFKRWLETNDAKKLASKTFTNYKSCIDTRIVKWLGDIKLNELSRSDLENFYNRILQEGSKKVYKQDSSPKQVGIETIKYYHAVIRRILNYAVYNDEIIDRNVALKITLPETYDEYDPEEELVKVFTDNELLILERHVIDTQYHELVDVALRTGMRRSELLALMWDCIDWKVGTIFIKQALVYTKDNGYEFKPTKNKKKRKIEVTKEVLDLLRQVQEKQDNIKKEFEEQVQKMNSKSGDKEIAFSDLYKDNNLIFCREDGQPMHPDTPSSWFPSFCVECELPRLTFHCLRHTHASHLLIGGEDISYVSARLGHSDVSVTYKRYAHFIPVEKRKSLQELEKKLKNKKR